MTALIGGASGAPARLKGDLGAVDGGPRSVTLLPSSSALAQDTTLPAGAIRFTVASTGNAAYYRVREQLAGHDLPNDAVGATQQFTGAITVDSTGVVIPEHSRFVVRVDSLKSDRSSRDGYVRRRLLETEQYPSVELVPTALRGVPTGFLLGKKKVVTGSLTFELLGNLTVHGVTRPTTWHITARQSDSGVTGTASTRFTFAEFGLTPPRVLVVLSVADTIGLEYDFTLTRTTSSRR